MKHQENALIEFLEQNPMEMRAFIDDWYRLNPISRMITIFRAWIGIGRQRTK